MLFLTALIPEKGVISVDSSREIGAPDPNPRSPYSRALIIKKGRRPKKKKKRVY